MTTQLFKEFLHEVEYLANKDMDATSEADFAHCPGGKARPATDYMAECGIFQSVIAQKLDNPDVQIDMNAQYSVLATIDSKAKAREMFTSGVNQFSATLDKISDSELNDEIVAPWGMSTTKGKLILHGLAHTMYHLGQLNQLQLIQGDEEVHWMEQPVEA
jgi:hypothetical protein